MRQTVTESDPRISVIAALMAVLLWPVIAPAQTTRLAPEEDAFFGQAVSISADGQHAVVGAALVNDQGVPQTEGNAYVFVRDEAGSWTQEAELDADDAPDGNTAFGTAVAINGDGRIAVVGSFLEDVGDNVEQGSAYVFVRDDTGTWTQEAKLTADDGAPSDRFGFDTAISADGNRIVVGSIWKDVDGNPDQGSAYVFTRGDDGSWTQEAQVTGSGTATSMWPNFGETVAIDADGNRLVAGSKLDDISGDDTNEGRAYVFDRSINGTWTEVATLATAAPTEADFFGNAVAINGDGSYVLVGSIFNDDPDIGGNNDAGAAYVFGPESLPVDVTSPEAPRQYELSGVYPNPLQGHGTLTLTLPETQQVRVALYNTLGQRVQTLHDGAMQGGESTLTLDVEGLPSGVYLLQVHSEEYTDHQKIVLAR